MTPAVIPRVASAADAPLTFAVPPLPIALLEGFEQDRASPRNEETGEKRVTSNLCVEVLGEEETEGERETTTALHDRSDSPSVLAIGFSRSSPHLFDTRDLLFATRP